MSKEKRIILICIIIITSIGINIYLLKHGQSPTLFYDNATFSNFSDDKVQRFVLKQDSEVQFQYDCSIESGKIHVKIYDEWENTIYENSSNNVKNSFSKVLAKGTYYYELNISDAKGMLNFKGEIK